MKCPFPYFGGKRRVADIVWDRFGDPINYVEPFAGSLAVLLERPHEPRTETVNDLDCYIANFWRATQCEPEKVVRYCDGPVNEADLHARHLWLVKRERFRERMKTDPHYFDAKVAGWWVWGICQWIGGGWCSRPDWRGRYRQDARPVGIFRKRNNLKRGGIGIHRTEWTRPKLSKRGGDGINRTEWRRPHAGRAQGVQRKLPVLKTGPNPPNQLPDISGCRGASGRGIHTASNKVTENLLAYFEALRDRLRTVRVCCGQWDRILGPSPTVAIGVTAVLLDPPYDREMRDDGLYTEDDHGVAGRAAEWARKHGHDKNLRIALCGYEGEHEMPPDWTVYRWKTNGGYGNANTKGRGKRNAARETIWFSPNCVPLLRQEELL